MMFLVQDVAAPVSFLPCRPQQPQERLNLAVPTLGAPEQGASMMCDALTLNGRQGALHSAGLKTRTTCSSAVNVECGCRGYQGVHSIALKYHDENTDDCEGCTRQRLHMIANKDSKAAIGRGAHEGKCGA